jgi:hypothetical protein
VRKYEDRKVENGKYQSNEQCVRGEMPGYIDANGEIVKGAFMMDNNFRGFNGKKYKLIRVECEEK